MTRAQILAKRKASRIKNLSRIVKLEIRRSCAFDSIDKCMDQLSIGLDSMEKAGLIKNSEIAEDNGMFTVSFQRPDELGGEWVVVDFNLTLQNL
jgi:hypothetical protein